MEIQAQRIQKLDRMEGARVDGQDRKGARGVLRSIYGRVIQQEVPIEQAHQQVRPSKRFK